MERYNARYRYATFAGGCFWCMVPPFKSIEGVVDVKSGYTGGSKPNPTYHEVSSGKTGHYEAVQVTYDLAITTYDRLLEIFWRQIDPTDNGGQFHDRGSQYMTAIFYHNEEQRMLAQESKERLQNSDKFNRPIATRILMASEFYPAEEYHQHYHEKNPEHYRRYKTGSGRQSYIEKVWKSDDSVSP